MAGRWALAPFLLLVIGGGLLIGFLTAPGPWYEALAKPSFNPPNWLFGPVWTVLYVLIAIAGWRVRRIAPSGTAMKLWWLQLVLNFLWSPVFFGLQQIALALVVIVALLVTILAFVAATWNLDRI
jgi:tryptophan-rich sensory protein